jgi:HTH-type transcriptional regulator, glycine betaine synthesis regulator
MGKKASKAHKQRSRVRPSVRGLERRTVVVPADPVMQPWRELCDCVGDFIRYWGFRRIHGEIWTQLFLSAEGLTGTQLAQRLHVSKALVSPALVELERHGLVFLQKTSGRDRVFVANGDVISAIKNVLLLREVKMVERARFHYDDLLRSSSRFSKLGIDENRVHELGRLFDLAQLLLQAASTWPSNHHHKPGVRR